MHHILVINGPNLNLLGVREPEIYGGLTLEKIEHALQKKYSNTVKLEFFHSNSESEIVEKIQSAMQQSHGLVINAGAYTHTSVAIRDAILAVSIPAIEVHLSNIFAREQFRHQSFISDICLGIISGLGPAGYDFAISALIDHLAKKKNQ